MKKTREATLRVTLLPRDTNRLGTIFGGVILSHIDLAASIEARRSGGEYNFVTVALDKVVFHEPVFVGDVVSFYAETTKKGRTSVAVRVSVEADRFEGSKRVKVTEADVVFVAVGTDRRPVVIS